MAEKKNAHNIWRQTGKCKKLRKNRKKGVDKKAAGWYDSQALERAGKKTAGGREAEKPRKA
ncbi:MAG TPA: hypothetical protein H9838_07340 [Candidatus Acutalibacter pullistercoris]|uniref:Uncharacterized protein n=1 Tax=Candidatus Acutalibacter pullistercoris TaxID=2838418 RepID=A0A9D2C1P6_9FIRM|nr:hypothetical protein [Candidatus Acutalibacter pullistercoris]